MWTWYKTHIIKKWCMVKTQSSSWPPQNPAPPAPLHRDNWEDSSALSSNFLCKSNICCSILYTHFASWLFPLKNLSQRSFQIINHCTFFNDYILFHYMDVLFFIWQFPYQQKFRLVLVFCFYKQCYSAMTYQACDERQWEEFTLTGSIPTLT